jgi:enoyl-CoA hydratase/carnithine racemase
MTVRIAHDGAVATLTLDRPDTLNAFDLERVVGHAARHA